jgi:hypothetical protein
MKHFIWLGLSLLLLGSAVARAACTETEVITWSDPQGLTVGVYSCKACGCRYTADPNGLTSAFRCKRVNCTLEMVLDDGTEADQSGEK